MAIIVKKWGNSLGIRLPKKIAKLLHIDSGTEVDVSVKDKEIIIKMHQSELDTLINKITPSNLHNETWEDDKTKGNEIW
jgi:antitoxin MazE